MGINFFETVFKDKVLNQNGDTQVCCPFPHHVGNTEYYEINPSAGVNLVKNVFHCFTCGEKYSENSMAAKILNTSYENAVKFNRLLHNTEDLSTWGYAERNLLLNDKIKELVINKLRIPERTIKELHLGYQGGGGTEFTIPIVIYGQIMDKVTYRPGQIPKYKREKDSLSGMIFPYDKWKEEPEDKPTLICAGEKDTIIARSRGMNAITFTGGENNTPIMFFNDFKNKDVYIIYDNDNTGKMGSKKIAIALKNYAKTIHVVDISNTCTEKGEDLWDYFCKYNKRREDLIQLLEETPEYTEEQFRQAKKEVYPTTDLINAIKPQNLNKVLKTSIQVIAANDAIYQTPTLVIATKTESDDDSDTMKTGDQRSWSLNENNYKELFNLIDSNLKEAAIEKYIKTNLLNIPKKETNITISLESKIPVYKYTVTDSLETYASNSSIELTAYSLNEKLETGKRYLATYKLVPHPQDGQRLIMVIKGVEESDDFLTSFKISDEVKNSLRKFQIKDTVANKLAELLGLAKGIVKADYDELLLKVIDIWFHSALQFKVGNNTILRGYIDCLLVGESRIGKSSTVAALQETYGVGKVVSLAGTAATSAGLIGGSDKVAGGYQTRAGVIPQNNRGAVIFEELIKCRMDLIKELTDIRSSNKVRIARVNGSIELPAFVRMLTLTNPKTTDGIPKPINTYPNGISILTDIVETPEDIARYDMIAIFGFEATKEIDPFYEPPEPLPKEDYQNRIRWIWSRKPEQIYISKTVYQYAVKQANELNKVYGTFINIFGVEAWQKIMRIAVAIAGYVCSTDEDFEIIYVTEEHIDEAIKLLLELYDNPTFKLREYVEEEHKYNELTDTNIEELSKIHKTNPILVDYLIKNPQTTKSNLQMVSNVKQEELDKIIYKLVTQNLVRIDKTYIITTNKFNKCYNKIDKEINLNREVHFRLDD